MKEGWKYKKLGEVCSYSIGLTYKPIDVCDDGTIVLRSSNIQNEMLDLNDVVRVNCPIKETLYVQKGDILMCSRNGSARLVGKVAMIPEINECMTYGTFMMVIRSLHNPFLLYFFKSDVFRKQIKHGEANMINQITRYMLDDVVVGLPPISEQKRIVERLDAAFAHIDELKANAEKQLTEARSLFQKCLTKAMEPKEGWEEKTVKDFSVLITKGSSPKWQGNSYVDTNGILFVTSENVRDGHLECRVSGGTFTLPSHGTVLDSLPSHGSSYLTLLFKLLIIPFISICEVADMGYTHPSNERTIVCCVLHI